MSERDLTAEELIEFTTTANETAKAVCDFVEDRDNFGKDSRAVVLGVMTAAVNIAIGQRLVGIVDGPGLIDTINQALKAKYDRGPRHQQRFN